MTRSTKIATVGIIVGSIVTAVVLGAYLARPIDNALCRQSKTVDEFRAGVLRENVIGVCDLDALRARLAKLGIETAAYPNGDTLDAITQCPGGFFRRRGFTLDLRLKDGCVDEVRIERHDTSP